MQHHLDYACFVRLLHNSVKDKAYAGRDLLNVAWDYKSFVQIIKNDVAVAIRQQQC